MVPLSPFLTYYNSTYALPCQPFIRHNTAQLGHAFYLGKALAEPYYGYGAYAGLENGSKYSGSVHSNEALTRLTVLRFSHFHCTQGSASLHLSMVQ